MKCIEGNGYGDICKKGIFKKVVKEGDRKFSLSDIRRILKAYKANSDKPNVYYGKVYKISNDEDIHFSVWFNSNSYCAIEIGCHSYDKATVERAIKAFL